MAQSYKVFFNDRTLFLTESASDSFFLNSPVYCLNPSEQEFKDFVNKFNEDTKTKTASICLDDSLNELLNRFKKHYKYIQAAGGLVENNEAQYLFIHRLGCWDLPKGKVEKDEHLAAAAIREVEEECGIEEPSIQSPICSTLHTYQHKGEMILKETFWYKMLYEGDETPTPQTSENIAIAKWVEKDDLDDILKNTYPSIREVISKVKNLNDLK